MPVLVLAALSLFVPGSGADMSRFTLSHVLAATGGRSRGFDRDDVAFERIATDSRSVRAGDLFWALSGENHDGHAFTRSAIAAGARGCVVSEEHEKRLVVPRVLVWNPRRALGDLARSHRERRDALVVGITGSVGKTTTRELVHAVLGTRFDGIASPRNYNNDLGVPLTLLELSDAHEYAAVEIAASAPDEIATLADIARPDVTIVTRVAPAHLAGFGSIDAIAAEKGALVEATAESGFAILNGDDPAVREMADRTACPVVLFGEGEHNDLRGHVVSVGFGELRVHVDGHDYTVPATGRHHLTGVLAAIALAREIGIGPLAIAEGLRRFEPAAGRAAVETIGAWTVVNDAYNASPAAMSAACELLVDCATDGPRILVAGDMRDLGAESDKWHAELGRTVAEAGIDALLFHGTQAERVAREARRAGMDAHRLAVCPDFDALTAVLNCTLRPGATVLVKGSRAMRMERVVTWLRTRAEEIESRRPTPARAA